MANYIGELAALLTACCWAAGSLFFESASRKIGSLTVNLLRMLIALVFLSGYCLIVRGLLVPMDAGAHAWFWLSLSGFIGFTIGDLCLFQAYVVIGSRRATLSMSLVPVLVTLLGLVILGEKLIVLQWLGMGITTLGVAWVILERTPKDSSDRIPQNQMGTLKVASKKAGIWLAVGSALCQAIGLVLSKYGMRSYNPFAATQIRAFAGTIGFVLLFFIAGYWPRVIPVLRNRSAMVYTGLGAFTGPFLGVALSLVAIQNTKVGVASTIIALTPLFVVPLVMLVYREKVSVRAVLGSCLAVFGVALLFLSPK